jgi:hypothetical protein
VVYLLKLQLEEGRQTVVAQVINKLLENCIRFALDPTRQINRSGWFDLAIDVLVDHADPDAGQTVKGELLQRLVVHILHDVNKKLNYWLHVTLPALHFHVVVGEVAGENDQHLYNLSEETLVIHFHSLLQIAHEYFPQRLLADTDVRVLGHLVVLLPLSHEESPEEQLNLGFSEDLVEFYRVFRCMKRDWHKCKFEHAVFGLDAAIGSKHFAQRLFHNLLLSCNGCI